MFHTRHAHPYTHVHEGIMKEEQTQNVVFLMWNTKRNYSDYKYSTVHSQSIGTRSQDSMEIYPVLIELMYPCKIWKNKFTKYLSQTKCINVF